MRYGFIIKTHPIAILSKPLFSQPSWWISEFAKAYLT